MTTYQLQQEERRLPQGAHPNSLLHHKSVWYRVRFNIREEQSGNLETRFFILEDNRLKIGYGDIELLKIQNYKVYSYRNAILYV